MVRPLGQVTLPTLQPFTPSWNGLRSTTEGEPMDTNRNTAAIYVRRSAADANNKDEDAFSRSLAAQERECLAWAERQGCL